MEEAVRKIDRRKERTQRLLRDALMELIVEKGYDAVSIQDIVDRANVARTTFYLHYDDKDELLFESMTAIYDQLASNWVPLMRQQLEENPAHPTLLDSSDYEHVARYAPFYRIMFSDKGSAGFILRVLHYLTSLMETRCIAFLTDSGEKTLLPVAMIAQGVAGMQMSLLLWWLENDMPYTPQEMARMSYYLVMPSLFKGIGMDIDIPDGVIPDDLREKIHLSPV
jgi:AcrR family transcriptional regulator